MLVPFAGLIEGTSENQLEEEGRFYVADDT